MKLTFIIFLFSCPWTYARVSAQIKDTLFTSNRISRTATITVDAKPGIVFPLFGAFEEKKWAQHWNPVPVYPVNEVMQEGTIFKTKARNVTEGEYMWYVTKYDSTAMIVQYLVSTVNRCWTITVHCSPGAAGKTDAKVTYEFTSLNNAGHEMNSEALNRMYQNNLLDWQTEINLFVRQLHVR